MSKSARICLLLVLVLSSTVIAAPAGAAAPELLPTPGECVEGSLPSGALSLICVPSSGWNGGLVVWGHGYIAPGEPLDFYHIALDDGTYLPTLIQSLGYAFATTSYRQNGLAILQGVGDVQELVAAFRAGYPAVGRIYMVGASEGGLITALLAERAPRGPSPAPCRCAARWATGASRWTTWATSGCCSITSSPACCPPPPSASRTT